MKKRTASELHNLQDSCLQGCGHFYYKHNQIIHNFDDDKSHVWKTRLMTNYKRVGQLTNQSRLGSWLVIKANNMYVSFQTQQLMIMTICSELLLTHYTKHVMLCGDYTKDYIGPICFSTHIRSYIMKWVCDQQGVRLQIRGVLAGYIVYLFY